MEASSLRAYEPIRTYQDASWVSKDQMPRIRCPSFCRAASSPRPEGPAVRFGLPSETWAYGAERARGVPDRTVISGEPPSLMDTNGRSAAGYGGH